MYLDSNSRTDSESSPLISDTFKDPYPVGLKVRYTASTRSVVKVIVGWDKSVGDRALAILGSLERPGDKVSQIRRAYHQEPRVDTWMPESDYSQWMELGETNGETIRASYFWAVYDDSTHGIVAGDLPKPVEKVVPKAVVKAVETDSIRNHSRSRWSLKDEDLLADYASVTTEAEVLRDEFNADAETRRSSGALADKLDKLYRGRKLAGCDLGDHIRDLIDALEDQGESEDYVRARLSTPVKVPAPISLSSITRLHAAGLMTDEAFKKAFALAA